MASSDTMAEPHPPLSYETAQRGMLKRILKEKCLADDDNDAPVHRYRIIVNRNDGAIPKPKLLALSNLDLARAVQQATGHEMAEVTRSADVTMSISYKVSIKNDPHTHYMVQLRYIGDVESINEIIRMVGSKVDPRVLPVPTAYPIDPKWLEQHLPGQKGQISKFVPGLMAYRAYPKMSHEQRLRFVWNFARAVNALWNLEVPKDTEIGSVVAGRDGDATRLSIAPEKQHSIGGPHGTVADFLCGYIRQRVTELEDLAPEGGLEDFKAKYLPLLKAYVESGMQNIPLIVEDVPVVLAHSDMGIHSVVVSENDPAEIVAVIDWEPVEICPFVALERLFENLFREPSANRQGPEYPGAAELRDALGGRCRNGRP